MSKTVEAGLIKELESNLALLVYDIPYPPKAVKAKKNFTPWFSWYDWSTRTLRYMGYPLQYSVVVIDEGSIEKVKEAIQRIEDKRESINKNFKLEIPEPDIRIVRFNLKTRADAEVLLEIIRKGLKQTLEAFIDDVESQLREGKDRTRIQERIKKFLKKIQRQDFLDLLIKDNELRNLILQLEILTA